MMKTSTQGRNLRPTPQYPDLDTALVGVSKAMRCGARSAVAVTEDGYVVRVERDANDRVVVAGVWRDGKPAIPAVWRMGRLLAPETWAGSVEGVKGDAAA